MTLETWTITVAINHTRWRDAIVMGRLGQDPDLVTLASDPNNLPKDTFVRGHIGIAYDFSTLKRFLTE